MVAVSVPLIRLLGNYQPRIKGKLLPSKRYFVLGLPGRLIPVLPNNRLRIDGQLVHSAATRLPRVHRNRVPSPPEIKVGLDLVAGRKRAAHSRPALIPESTRLQHLARTQRDALPCQRLCDFLVLVRIDLPTLLSRVTRAPNPVRSFFAMVREERCRGSLIRSHEFLGFLIRQHSRSLSE